MSHEFVVGFSLMEADEIDSANETHGYRAINETLCQVVSNNDKSAKSIGNDQTKYTDGSKDGVVFEI